MTVLADFPERESAERLARMYEGEWTVVEREERIEEEAPPPPYTTAELLADAVARLGWTAAQTITAAQSLFEQGYITYPRTDSTWVAPEARADARRIILEQYGENALGNLSLGADHSADAHEAIRPSQAARLPDALDVSPQEQALYRLIWLRFLAAHMRPARLQVVSITLEKET